MQQWEGYTLIFLLRCRRRMSSEEGKLLCGLNGSCLRLQVAWLTKATSLFCRLSAMVARLCSNISGYVTFHLFLLGFWSGGAEILTYQWLGQWLCSSTGKRRPRERPEKSLFCRFQIGRPAPQKNSLLWMYHGLGSADEPNYWLGLLGCFDLHFRF